MKMWIARNSDGTLVIFQEMPNLSNDMGSRWWWSNDDCMALNKDSFPEVTFENSPMEVELKLIEK